MPFKFGDIDVHAYVGPRTTHIVLGIKVGPPVRKDEKPRRRVSRERGYKVPSPEIFPANLYTELVATQSLEIEDALATAFLDQDKAARDEMLRRAAQKQDLFRSALDYVAGVLGLRLHYQLVATPIIEQCVAYRGKGAPYALATTLHCKVTDAYHWDISDDTATMQQLPELQPDWKPRRAAKVLAWLLRAWATKSGFTCCTPHQPSRPPASPDNTVLAARRITELDEDFVHRVLQLALVMNEVDCQPVHLLRGERPA